MSISARRFAVRIPAGRVLAALALSASLIAPYLGAARPVVAASCEEGAVPGEARLSVEDRAVLATVRELPLELRVGQLLMPGFVGTDPDAGLLQRVARGRLGGLFLLGRNVRSEEQVKQLTEQLSTAAAGATGGIRPFIATDFEGGIVNALRAVTGNTPSAAQLAARGPVGVQAHGEQDAEALRWLGFNTNLAPVADVLSEPSQVIGSRSFSSDPGQAAALSRAYARGLQSHGVVAVMKHYPGHGATAGDSHLMLPTVERSLAQLEAADLVPYRQAIEAGELQAVMVGHLYVPSIDPEMPTSLSRPAIQGLLRDRMRFGGLVMTDELKMRAISERYGVEQAAVTAVNAGVDVILADYTGVEQDLVFNTLVRACRDGRLAPGAVDQSAMRILRLKLRFSLAGQAIQDRYGVHLAALTAPPAAEPPAEAAPAEGETPTGDVPESEMPEGEMMASEEGAMPAEGDATATPTPDQLTPTPAPTAVSTQPTPTPVSVQPSPTRPPPSPAPTATSTSTATRTPTPTARP